jgi:adenosine deaminase
VERMGLTSHDLREITRTAIDAAFCDEALKAILRSRL